MYRMDVVGLKCIEVHGSSHQRHKNTQANKDHRAEKAKRNHLCKHDMSLAVLWCTADDSDWLDALHSLLQTGVPAYIETSQGQLSGHMS
jgi:hypothetical protein